jgi:succinate dehydrogenase/fumarate reductase-like Fe-S protein
LERAVSKRTLHIWRGDTAGGDLVAYEIEAETGMVVLDAVLEVQRSQANDLAVRWNCKAANDVRHGLRVAVCTACQRFC